MVPDSQLLLLEKFNMSLLLLPLHQLLLSKYPLLLLSEDLLLELILTEKQLPLLLKTKYPLLFTFSIYTRSRMLNKRRWTVFLLMRRVGMGTLALRRGRRG